MPSCTSCQSFVTRQYARVFGDNRNRVLACPNCAPYAEYSAAARTGEG